MDTSGVVIEVGPAVVVPSQPPSQLHLNHAFQMRVVLTSVQLIPRSVAPAITLFSCTNKSWGFNDTSMLDADSIVNANHVLKFRCRRGFNVSSLLRDLGRYCILTHEAISLLC